MTAPAPEQLRSLANNDALMFIEVGEDIRTALRTAADQLEAVQAWKRTWDLSTGAEVALDAILTANTAPQEPTVGHYESDTFVPHYPGEPWVSLVKRTAPQEAIR